MRNECTRLFEIVDKKLTLITNQNTDEGRQIEKRRSHST